MFLGAALAATSAMAVPVTIDFSSGSASGSFSPYLEDGFSLAPLNPSNHHEWNGSVFNWHDGSANNPPNTMIFTDLTGDLLFDALSVQVVNNPQGLRFTPSVGTVVDVAPGVTGTITLGFENIADFRINVINAGNSFPITIDNLVADHTQSVPEPVSTLGLLALAAASMIGLAGKKR